MTHVPGEILAEMTVVIPVGPDEREWTRLVDDLTQLPKQTEILFVGPPMPKDAPRFLSALARGPVRWIVSPPGRALQMNLGAREAKGKYLWFLHSDSVFGAEALEALEASLHRAPDALHYFDLSFMSDGPIMTLLNTLGTWVRSHWLLMPFGDQGFCLQRSIFERLGGFPESAAYGEDHLLIWAAHRQGVPVRCVGTFLETSARKYRERGWARTTITHLLLTYRQAIPQFLILLREKFKR